MPPLTGYCANVAPFALALSAPLNVRRPALGCDLLVAEGWVLCEVRQKLGYQLIISVTKGTFDSPRLLFAEVPGYFGDLGFHACLALRCGFHLTISTAELCKSWRPFS